MTRLTRERLSRCNHNHPKRQGSLTRLCPHQGGQYRRVVREINHRYDPHFDRIRHIDRKWRNNLIESYHAAMKRLFGYRQSFRSLRTAKATLSGLETLKQGHIRHKQSGILGELQFIAKLFEAA